MNDTNDTEGHRATLGVLHPEGHPTLSLKSVGVQCPSWRPSIGERNDAAELQGQPVSGHEKDDDGGQHMNPELRKFIARVVVPALLERFLREQAAANLNPTPKRPAA